MSWSAAAGKGEELEAAGLDLIRIVSDPDTATYPKPQATWEKLDSTPMKQPSRLRSASRIAVLLLACLSAAWA